MRTQLQIEASRSNGSLSRGPVTEEGKNRSRLNAARHMLSASPATLDAESNEEYQQFLQDYLARYRPLDAPELDKVQQMVFCQWQLSRAAGLETALLDDAIQSLLAQVPEGETPNTNQILAVAFTSLLESTQTVDRFEEETAPGKSTVRIVTTKRPSPWENIQRHQARLLRQYERAHAALTDLQSTRPRALPAPASQNEPKPAPPPPPPPAQPDPQNEPKPVKWHKPCPCGVDIPYKFHCGKEAWLNYYPENRDNR